MSKYAISLVEEADTTLGKIYKIIDIHDDGSISFLDDCNDMYYLYKEECVVVDLNDNIYNTLYGEVK